MPKNEGPLLTDEQADQISRRKTLISFAAFGVTSLSMYGSWRWLMSRTPADGVPWPFRRVLQINEKLSQSLFHTSSRMDELPLGTPTPKTRLNSSIGVDESVAAADYRLTLSGIAGGKRTITLDELRSLPAVQQKTKLCCIEGWSTWGEWTGARMVDLLAKYPPANNPPHVAMSTDNRAYYVGLDIASVMHPQTILAYKLDGKPLSYAHGFPVRLVIPTKYGIKNIKQLSRIDLTQNRPADYWAEQGYDWYAGL